MATDEQIQRIEAKIDTLGTNLGQKLSKVAEELVAVKTTCPTCQRDIEAMWTILHGPPENGDKPGLIAVVRDNTKAHTKIRRTVRKLIAAVGAIALVLLGALAQPLFAKVFGG